MRKRKTIVIQNGLNDSVSLVRQRQNNPFLIVHYSFLSNLFYNVSRVSPKKCIHAFNNYKSSVYLNTVDFKIELPVIESVYTFWKDILYI